MMEFVFDHNALLYMLEQFPRNLGTEVWNIFDKYCKNGKIISHRESQKLLEQEAVEQATLTWSKSNSAIFRTSTTAEVELLGQMMGKKEFDFLITSRLMERRMPEEAPFLLCIAKKHDRVLVYRKNTGRDFGNSVKKVCDNYGIKYMEVEDCLMRLKSLEESASRQS